MSKELKRDLGLFSLTMIAVGSTIGSGIFFTPSKILETVPSPFLVLIVWVLGGLMALTGALTYAELGGLFPKAGGLYVYIKESFGPLPGFLYGWAQLVVVNTGSIAALSVAYTQCVAYFIPLDPFMKKIFAVCGIIVLTVINLFGVKQSGILSNLFTLLKLSGIGILIFTGLGMGTTHLNNFSFSSDSFSFTTITAMAAAMIGVLWSCGGWQHTSYLSAEAKNPSRTVPMAMMMGALIVTVVYLLVNVSYLMLLPADKIILSKNVAADAVGTVWGTAGASIILLTIFISTIGTTAIYTMSAPRIYYAMAQDKIFFKKAGEIHPKFGTPLYAIIGQSVWACVLVLFWGTFENLISYVVFTDWIFFALAGASIFVFRKKIPEAERPYKTFGYPLTPLFFTGISCYIVINTLITKPEQAIAGLILLGTGVVVYFVWLFRAKQKADHIRK